MSKKDIGNEWKKIFKYFFLRRTRARSYFFLPAKKVGKNASSIAVLDFVRLDIGSADAP